MSTSFLIRTKRWTFLAWVNIAAVTQHRILHRKTSDDCYAPTYNIIYLRRGGPATTMALALQNDVMWSTTLTQCPNVLQAGNWLADNSIAGSWTSCGDWLIRLLVYRSATVPVTVIMKASRLPDCWPKRDWLSISKRICHYIHYKMW